MRILNTWMKRWYGERKVAPRRRELEEELSAEFGQAVRLQLMGDGGADSVYCAIAGGTRLGVVRLTNGHRQKWLKLGRSKPAPTEQPWQALRPADRLDREWDTYSCLSTRGLTPKPLWRTTDAIMCSYFEGKRLTEQLTAGPRPYWQAMQRVLAALGRMHAGGICHMDAKVQNILTDRSGETVLFVDFDRLPATWVSWPQQKAFDYLRLIDTALRFLPEAAPAGYRRWRDLLEPHVEEDVRQAAVAPLLGTHATRHVARNRELRDVLQSVFHKL